MSCHVFPFFFLSYLSILLFIQSSIHFRWRILLLSSSSRCYTFLQCITIWCTMFYNHPPSPFFSFNGILSYIQGHLGDAEMMKEHVEEALTLTGALNGPGISKLTLASVYHKLASSFLSSVSTASTRTQHYRTLCCSATVTLSETKTSWMICGVWSVVCGVWCGVWGVGIMWHVMHVLTWRLRSHCWYAFQYYLFKVNNGSHIIYLKAIKFQTSSINLLCCSQHLLKSHNPFL